LKDLTGHTSDTILIVESAKANIQWTEPRDLSLDDIPSRAAPESASIIQCPHMYDNGYFYHETPSGANVAFVDGSIRFLPAGLFAAKNLRQLLAVGGANEEYIENPLNTTDELRIHWPHCIAFAVWVASSGLLLVWAVRSRKKGGVTGGERVPEGDTIAGG
jgi:prepilin-type processing-associated H-X9-DG protein